MSDPYAERKSAWPKLVDIVVVLWLAYAILNSMGYVYEWSNGRLGRPKAVKVELQVPLNHPNPKRRSQGKPHNRRRARYP